MREMRRTDRRFTEEEAYALLQRGEYGILATADPDGQPYGVPLSYAVLDRVVYYHSTNAESSKHDNIKSNPKVSFTVVGNTQVIPEKFGTLYESVIVFGEASFVEDEAETVVAYGELLKKYCADFLPEGEQYRLSSGPRTVIGKISIHSLTGKGRKE